MALVVLNICDTVMTAYIYSEYLCLPRLWYNCLVRHDFACSVTYVILYTIVFVMYLLYWLVTGETCYVLGTVMIVLLREPCDLLYEIRYY